MRRLTLNIFFLMLCSFPTAACAQTAENVAAPVTRWVPGEKLTRPGLPKLGKISDALYRGAQPHAEGLPELKKLGVNTIVDLRGEDPGKIKWEREQTEALGMRFISMPASGWSPPSDTQIAVFLAIFREHPDAKVFVHCRFGDDRTGVFVASYRIVYNGWPAEEAIKEMYFFSFNGFWHPAMKAYVRGLPASLKTSAALAPFAKP